MKEEIQKIVKNSSRALENIEIMKKIKLNYTVDDLKELNKELDSLCSSGLIRTTKKGGYVINENLTGIVDKHERGNAHVIIPGQEDLFISKNNLNNAKDGDTVFVEITNKQKNEGKVTKILKRAIGNNIAEVINDNGTLKVVPLIKDLEFDVEIEKSDLNLVEGEYVHIDYVKDLSKNKILAKIDKKLGHKNALLNEGQEPSLISGEIAKIACEFELSLLFPDEVLQEAKKMPKELSKEMIDDGIQNGREDFRNEIIFTIDGKDTKDIDDAISIKILPNGNYELGVHIADVSHYVKPGSALWNEAENRGNSNYLGNKVLPMLPVELSNGICSLNEHVDRFTTSCIMEIDHSGKVVNKRVVKGIINSKKKMNYDAVQDLIDGKDTVETKDYTTLEYTLRSGETLNDVAFSYAIPLDELEKYNPDFVEKEGSIVNVPCKNIIKNAYSLSKKIDAFKHERGEIIFEGEEAKIYQSDKDDEPYDVKPRPQRPAERLIENFMVAANEQIAIFLTECNMPTYRVHEKPLEKKMSEYLKYLEILGIHYKQNIDLNNITSRDCQKILEFLKDEKLFKILNKKLLRSMKKACYSTKNLGHFGIASPFYTHFTSPIRRFDDLLNHTSLGYILEEDRLEDKFIKQWNAYLTNICEHISECERNSEKCEYAVDDMLKARYMEKYIGEEYECTVDTIMQGAFFVQTDNYIDGRVDRILTNDSDGFKSVASYYDYDEDRMLYTRNNRTDLRCGDRVLVKCINANYIEREVDFALVRKL